MAHSKNIGLCNIFYIYISDSSIEEVGSSTGKISYTTAGLIVCELSVVWSKDFVFALFFCKEIY